MQRRLYFGASIKSGVSFEVSVGPVHAERVVVPVLSLPKYENSDVKYPLESLC